MMKLSTKMFLNYDLTGIFRIVFGILGCLGNETIRYIAVSCLLISSIVQLIAVKANSEKSDEMSEENLKEAQSQAGNLTRIVVLVLSGLLVVISVIPQTKPLLSFLDTNPVICIFYAVYVIFGIEDVITGVKFRSLEKD